MISLADRIKKWVIQYAGELHHEDIDRFRSMAERFKAETQRSYESDLNANAIGMDEEERYQYASHVEDIYASSGSAVNLAHSMAIVALHSRIEIGRKKILLAVLPELNARNLADIRYLRKEVYDSLPEAEETPEVREIRLINNCIKHSEARASSELAQHFGYEEGEYLGDLDQTFDRLLDPAKAYLKELSQAASLRIL